MKTAAAETFPSPPLLAGPLSAVLDLLLLGAASNEAPPVKRGRSRSEYRRMRPLVFQSVSPDYRRRGFT